MFVEAGSSIEREVYLSMLVARARQRVAIIASAAGGMDIEEGAARTPEKILTTVLHPAAGLEAYQARQMGDQLGLNSEQSRQFIDICQKLYRLFCDLDAGLVEINPLIVTGDGNLLALDAKLNIEDNALFRQAELQAMRDPSQEDEMERPASSPSSSGTGSAPAASARGASTPRAAPTKPRASPSSASGCASSRPRR